MNDLEVKKEKQTAGLIEQKHLTQRRNNTYIACEEMDFTWSYEQVEQFDFLWSEGQALDNIAEYLHRDIDEVALLLMDRMKKGKVSTRRNGIGGESQWMQ